MEILGRLVRVLPEQSGDSAKGRWIRGGFVIETSEQYPKQVAFTMFGEDKVAMIKGIAMGAQLNVHFSPESREFQGRWYTDLRCFRIDVFTPASVEINNSWNINNNDIYPPQQPNKNVDSPFMPNNDIMLDVEDDLPFD